MKRNRCICTLRGHLWVSSDWASPSLTVVHPKKILSFNYTGILQIYHKLYKYVIIVNKHYKIRFLRSKIYNLFFKMRWLHSLINLLMRISKVLQILKKKIVPTNWTLKIMVDNVQLKSVKSKVRSVYCM